MSPSEEHEDVYSVSPAAMSDEQIALRDAMTVTAVDQAESVAAIAASLHSLLDGLCKSVERLERERDEMRTVIAEIMSIEPSAYRNMDGTSVVHINKYLFDRAKLLAGG